MFLRVSAALLQRFDALWCGLAAICCARFLAELQPFLLWLLLSGFFNPSPRTSAALMLIVLAERILLLVEQTLLTLSLQLCAELLH